MNGLPVHTLTGVALGDSCI